MVRIRVGRGPVREWKSDADIAKEFGDFTIQSITVNPGGQSGEIVARFPSWGAHVAGGMETVCDHWILYPDGTIGWDYWYPECVSRTFERAVRAKLVRPSSS